MICRLIGDTMKNHWISVADALPKEGGTYLVATDNGAVCTTHFYKSGHFGGGSVGNHVTHWMALPAPPNQHVIPLRKRSYEELSKILVEKIGELETLKADIKEHHTDICLICEHGEQECTNLDYDCINCNDPCECQSCRKCSNWEWRGV